MLHPDSVEVCLDWPYFVSVYNMNLGKEVVHQGKGCALGQ
jgi:hypothetical protein